MTCVITITLLDYFSSRSKAGLSPLSASHLLGLSKLHRLKISPSRVFLGGICIFSKGGLATTTAKKAGVLMIHIYCETCDGWDSYPVGGSHDCESGNTTSQGEMNLRGQFVMSADWSDDSDY